MIIGNDIYYDLDNQIKIGPDSITMSYTEGTIAASGNITTNDNLISDNDLFVGSATQSNIDMDGTGNLFVLNDLGVTGKVNISNSGVDIITQDGVLIIRG